MVTIEEVTENGLKCGLICPSPACGRELVACLRVTKKRPYLRHHRAPCQFSGESALHKYAKQLIQLHGSILVPKVQLEGKTLREARQLKFDSVVLEHRFHSIIPDIIANVGSHQLLIEIKVTHACDERKTAILANKSLNTVEIDLSHLERAGVPVAEFDRAILESAPRVWLYNHRIGKELEARREAQEHHDIEVARFHIEQLRDRLFLSDFEGADPSEKEHYVRIRDLGEFIDIGVNVPNV